MNMIKLPKFSIIIPVYNVENYLSECLEHVIGQTLLDIEIICVNDGARDHSGDILKEYQKLDHRVRIVEKENGGLSSARNAGLKAAAGEYIVFLDSDDYLEKHACERLYYEVLEHHPDIIVFGAHIFPYYPWPDPWLINNLTTRTIAYKNGGLEALLHENGARPFVWRNCFKQSFLKEQELYFDESIRFAEDLIFQFMAFPLAEQVIFISDKLYHYRWRRDGSLMANAAKDPYEKYAHHIRALYVIAEFWKEKKLLEAYKKEFMAWTVSFIGWDLYNYHGYWKEDLIRKTCHFWEEYDLLAQTGKLPVKDRIYYLYIRNYFNKGSLKA